MPDTQLHFTIGMCNLNLSVLLTPFGVNADRSGVVVKVNGA